MLKPMSMMNSLARWSLALLLLPTVCLAAPPPAPGKTVPLFDGHSLQGWEGDPKLWRVEDGMIAGGSLTEAVQRNEFLATTRPYTNFIVRMRIKLTGTEGFINSGFQIRSQRVPNDSEMSGYQCDYGDPSWWAGLYDESRRNRNLVAADMAVIEPVLHRNDWNEFVIRADGPRITTWLNGVQGIDYTEPDGSIPQHGLMGIQVHGGGKALVQVKDLTLEELPATPPGTAFIGAPEPGKASKPSPLLPRDEQASFTLPPGFEIELVAAEEPGLAGKFVAVNFDQRGRMWTMTAFEYPVDGNENPAVAEALYASPGKDKVLVYDTPFAPGLQHPRVFADGLAIPLGLLPYGDGALVLHGPEIVFLHDTDGDGKADKRETVLSGFGVQDSHLFPHQFTRAPGNWLWMAQGAFNYGKVRTKDGESESFDQTRMTRFRVDGSQFDITSQGPCNIWGLVIGPEGETWIQEANDYGYPAMRFHDYANYPGCTDGQFKSYAPVFPGTAPDFSMGGTGLSGLALSDAQGAWPAPYADTLYVANPIIREVQALRVERDGPGYRLSKLPSFIRSSDEFFRPVAMTTGPDGCLYIVDWYNKIISHNEVARNHPDRDKTRGRIWRVKHSSQKPFAVPDFTTLPPDELVAKLGGQSLAQSHLAWQAITDRQLATLAPALKTVLADDTQAAARRIASLWALEGLHSVDAASLQPPLKSSNRNLRREAIRALGEAKLPGLVATLASLAEDPDPEVRAQVIRTVGGSIGQPYGIGFPKAASVPSAAFHLLVSMARPSLDGPTAPSTQNGRPQKVREAYDREFERYLVRLFLETRPAELAAWLDSKEAAALPVENRLVAALALEPASSASRVARLLPEISRPPGTEELLRLVQFPDQPGVADALLRLLKIPGNIDALLSIRTRFNAGQLEAVLTKSAKALLADDHQRPLGLRVAAGFKLAALEPDLIALLGTNPSDAPAVLNALAQIGSGQADLFARYVRESTDADTRTEAFKALTAAKSERTAALVAPFWPKLSPGERRSALQQLSGSPATARGLVSVFRAGAIPPADLDSATLEKLQAVLPGDADLNALIAGLGDVLRTVVLLDGTDEAALESGVTLDGACTIEAWVRLNPGINNQDSLLLAPAPFDLNFYDAHFRVWAGGGAGDVVVSRKPFAPDLWTHLAATRDGAGIWRLYLNGELDATASQPAPGPLQNPLIGASGPKGGTAGAFCEIRLWNRALSTDEIRSGFDRSYAGQTKPEGLVFLATGDGSWGKLHTGARLVKSLDHPPLLTAAQAAEMDTKFAHFRTLAQQPGDVPRGKAVAATCLACHLVKGDGGNIGPDLSGVGALSTEALLRNILTPNAAMEAGYRTYRVELTDGDLLDGLFVREDAAAVVLRVPGQGEQRIEKKGIRDARFLRRSLMPEGLLESLPDQQVADLFSYLRSVK
jgi:putative membrane-bound dehydrogenase-like protein